MSPIKDKMKEKIDNYNDTIFAIIGFMNFYRFDDVKRSMKDDVICFQGNKLKRSSEETEVTPDVGIILPDRNAIVAEAKKSFPKDKTRWDDDFQQLLGYDDNLTQFPTNDGTVNDYELVLLLHTTRAVDVIDFYKENSYKFSHSLSFVEFSRSDEANPFFFFRVADGKLKFGNMQSRLRSGVAVPMELFFSAYASVKFYDAEPPLPWILTVIWGEIVTQKVAQKEDMKNIRKDQKVSIEIEVDEIVEELQEQLEEDIQI